MLNYSAYSRSGNNTEYYPAPGVPRGECTLIFYTNVGSDHFLGFKIMNFKKKIGEGGGSEKLIFWGV